MRLLYLYIKNIIWRVTLSDYQRLTVISHRQTWQAEEEFVTDYVMNVAEHIFSEKKKDFANTFLAQNSVTWE